MRFWGWSAPSSRSSAWGRCSICWGGPVGRPGTPCRLRLRDAPGSPRARALRRPGRAPRCWQLLRRRRALSRSATAAPWRSRGGGADPGRATSPRALVRVAETMMPGAVLNVPTIPAIEYRVLVPGAARARRRLAPTVAAAENPVMRYLAGDAGQRAAEYGAQERSLREAGGFVVVYWWRGPPTRSAVLERKRDPVRQRGRGRTRPHAGRAAASTSSRPRRAVAAPPLATVRPDHRAAFGRPESMSRYARVSRSHGPSARTACGMAPRIVLWKARLTSDASKAGPAIRGRGLTIDETRSSGAQRRRAMPGAGRGLGGARSTCSRAQTAGDGPTRRRVRSTRATPRMRRVPDVIAETNQQPAPRA